ncbi:glutathione S-transferase N-terminal domain-containing protein [Novosphingobium beihaiensis]|uniref:Glutathione S-transferase N-terminal domain-containing protein n=1 Tax=Novosphingobium beihaiensis TaxID=2930389 RepID=A0ABT0BTP9_9SPHN|nr:glutathione S-transferase N-terminal domain-containing protein [Novosphingobium beihaiensis]MCJ2188440.1 glutathione S-transferase N-terminal domain-containing protein [Novosphingobium beihaiensis]
MIDFYFAQTPNAAKILIALKELDLPYKVIRYDLYQGEHLNADFRKINPNLKIPAIVDTAPLDGGEPLPVFETGAILTYLAERCGALIPEDPRGRIAAFQWLAWQISGLGPFMGQAAHFLRYAPPGPHEYSRNRYVNESVRLLHVMDYRLKRVPYLAGEEYSIADIACFPVIHYFGQYFEFDFLSLAAVRRWYETLLARPGVKAAIDSPEMDPGRYYDTAPVLTEDEWSNVFGERMLQASAAD